MRPRWIYFAYFSFRAVSIGRFSSVFYLDRGVEASEMGMLFAGDALIGAVSTTVVTAYVDKLLAGGVLHARERAIRLSFALSTIAFCSQCVNDFGLQGKLRSAVFMASRWLNAVVFSPCVPIIDAHTLVALGGDRGRFGEERLYGAVSWAIISMILGVLIDYVGSWIMFVFTFVGGVAAVVMMSSQTTSKHIQLPKAAADGDVSPISPTNAYRGAGSSNVSGKRLLMAYARDPKVFSFLFAVFCLGMGMSLVENLLFLLFVQDLGSSNALCGFSVVVTVAFEIPIFWVGKRLLERLGVTVLFSIGMVCYIIRAIGYTLCPNGWCVIGFEPLHGVTYGCTALAGVEYIASVTPPEQLTTGQGIKSAIQVGGGYFFGTLTGGMVIQAFGERTLYRGAACFVLLGLVLYLHGRTLPDRPLQTDELGPVTAPTFGKPIVLDADLDEEPAEAPAAAKGVVKRQVS